MNTTPLVLAQRDRQVLTLIARLRFVQRPQLQALLYSDRNPNDHSAAVMTRRTLGRLRQHQLVASLEPRVGGAVGGSTSPIHFLTRTGAQALAVESERAPRPPRGTLLVRHALATADVVVALQRHARLHEDELGWQTDREVGAELGPLPVLPDLYVTYATRTLELHAFVEVDLGSEGSRILAEKTAKYLDTWHAGRVQEQLGLWPVVAWVVPNDARAGVMLRTIEEVLATRDDDAARGTEFACTTFADLEHGGGPRNAIWHVVGRAGRHALAEDDR
jgi:hypothetical protein